MNVSKSNNDDTATQDASADFKKDLGYSEKNKEIPIDVTLSDGAVIRAWVHPGFGTPIVFLYGLGCSLKHWKYQVSHFQKQNRLTVQFDYRGHGQSNLGNPKRPLSISSLSADTSEILAQLGIKHAVLCGQSLGGTIGLRVAHDFPDLVQALILQSSPGREPFSKISFAGGKFETIVKTLGSINKTMPRLTRLINSAAGKAPHLTRELVRMYGFNEGLARSADIEDYLTDFFNSDPNIFYELMDDLCNINISKWPQVIDCPALILAGAQDKVVHIEELKWLAKRLPGSELEIFSHGSHCIHLEDPGVVNRRMEQFIKTHDF